MLLGLGGYMCWSFYSSADHFAVDADNGWFQLLVPVLMVLSGVAVAAWAKWVRKSDYFTSGRATDADAADLLEAAPVSA